jgi:hypothetical protein
MKQFFNDALNQLWTLLGMFIAYIVLEGSAKTLVGNLLIVAIIIWFATFPLRNKE